LAWWFWVIYFTVRAKLVPSISPSECGLIGGMLNVIADIYSILFVSMLDKRSPLALQVLVLSETCLSLQ